MSGKKKIEQLFSERFESYESNPSDKVWKNIRKDLFIKNFLHFSPFRLNIWYAGGLLSIALSILLLTDIQKESYRQESSRIQISDSLSLSGDSLQVTDNQTTKSTDNTFIKLLPASRPNETKEEETRTDQNNPVLPVPRTIQSEPFIGENNSVKSVYAWFNCSTSEGCVPLQVGFTNLSQNAARYQWSFGDGGSSVETDPDYIFDEPGTWFVSLTAFNESGELSVFTDSIKVYPTPQARFTMDVQETNSNERNVYFYNYSLGASSYLWDFGDGNTSDLKEPDHYFSRKSSVNITLYAYSAEGCLDSTQLKNALSTGEPAFVFPTAFSPNLTGPKNGQYSRNSGDNDVFFPVVAEEPEEYQLRIFNRNGIMIFESTDIHFGWDGYYREELQSQGVYVWKARARFADGRSVVKMGDVTLLYGDK